MTGNPVLSRNTFTGIQESGRGGVMSIQGTVNKASLLLVITTVSAAYTWRMYFNDHQADMMPWVMGGAIAGFVFAMVTCFKKSWSPVTAPIYAVCEGLFIGGLSSIFEAQMPGIVLQAVMLTFGTLAALLGAYKMRFIAAVAMYPERQDQLKKVIDQMATIDTAMIQADEMSKRGDYAGAWEIAEKTFEKYPDDSKLNEMRADLTTQAADFVRTLRTAQDLEQKDEVGSSLAWYLKAQKIYPNSDFAQDGIHRLSRKVLPESS